MADTAPTRCVIYLRISLDQTGEELAIQRQREQCQRIAQQRGWEIVAEYSDNSISATSKTKKRPGYDDLVAGYKAGQYDAVVCYDLDRLTRQPRQLEDWIDAAEDRGLLLITANGEADLSTDGGRMFARIKAAVARSEVDRKSRRQQDAAAQRSALGRPPLGVRLTGYTPKGDVIGHEAALVKQVFDRFAAGDSLRSLAAWLTESGVPTRHGRPWNPSSVRTMLTNPRYAGHAVYKGKVNGKRGSWERIVDEEILTFVRSQLADPRRRTQEGTDRKHLGAGLFECALCNAKVRSWSGNRYRCPNGCITRSQTSINALVLDSLSEVLGRADVADLIPPQESREASAIGGKITRLRTRLANIEEDYDAGHIDGPRYRVAAEKVRTELAAAQREQARLASSKGMEWILLAPDPRAAFDAAPLMIKRNVLDALFVVRLTAAPRGRKTFDENTVRIEPRSTAPVPPTRV